MIVRECGSRTGECPCLHCDKFCCEEDIFDTEILCETAREFCESVPRGEKEGGVNERKNMA